MDEQSGPAPIRRILIIYNPTAGRRRLHRLQGTLEELRAQGVDTVLSPTGAPGDARALARTVTEVDLVAAAGGDGTINEVLNGLMAARAAGRNVPPLGLIPLGTANVLAREIGLATDPASIVATLLGKTILQFRPGRLVQGKDIRYFAMMAGIGFDADVVSHVDLRRKRLLGRGAYAMASAGRFFDHTPRLFGLSVDGIPERAASVIVTRGRHYAGAYIVAPEAKLARPQLHVCLFARPDRWAVLRYGLALLANRLPNAAHYRVVPAQRVEIGGGSGDAVQADGDIVGALPLVVDVAEWAIPLKVPPAAEGRR